MTAEKMCSPRQMFQLMGWQVPKNATNRATSWDEAAKRLRQGVAA